MKTPRKISLLVQEPLGSLTPAWRHFIREVAGESRTFQTKSKNKKVRCGLLSLLSPGDQESRLLSRLWAYCCGLPQLALVLCRSGVVVLTHLRRLLERLINLIGTFEDRVHS